MSWLARSIANSLAVNDAAGFLPEEDRKVLDEKKHSSAPTPSSPPEGPQGRGVKDDLSEIKNSLARQLRGVASFLAPPPQPSSKNDGESGNDEADSGKIDGIRSDFAEIGGKVKAGISKLLQIRPDGGDEDRNHEYTEKSVVGVTEEVLAFVKDLVVHPRTWVRFPLPEDSDADEFALNDCQQAHVGAVERQVPELADLRWELCPDNMSEGRFWMIYFVLVHPKLDKYDALTLSTPKIVEARAMLTQDSKYRRKEVKQPEGTPVSTNVQDAPLQSMKPSTKDVPAGSSTTALEPQIHNGTSDENFPTDNPGPKEDSAVEDPIHLKDVNHGSSEILVQSDDDDGDDWFNEEAPDVHGSSARNIRISNDEDVSFSDLEEDDDVVVAKGDNK